MNEELDENLINFINNIAENVFLVQLVVSVVGLIMTVPHLIVLLHPSMRTSSSNSLMIGIALCDLTVLSGSVYERVQSDWIFAADNPCANNLNYWYQLSILVNDVFREACERASFWIGVFLALTRLLIMKLSGNTEFFSKPKTGCLLVLFILVLSSALTAYYYSTFRLRQWGGQWEPDHECLGFPVNYSEDLYFRKITDQFTFDAIQNTYFFVNGISGILISLLYPSLGLFLFLEIRKSASYASAALSKRASLERHRTSQMILAMTIFYVIASAPGGASEIVQLFVTITSNSILNTLVAYGSIFISTLFCINATSHGLINFTMSSKYRDAAKMIFCLQKGSGRTSSIHNNN